MTDLTTIGFKAETSGLTKAQTELDKTATAGGKVDASVTKLEATIGRLGTELATANTKIDASTKHIGLLEKELLASANRADKFEYQLGKMGKKLTSATSLIKKMKLELNELKGSGGSGGGAGGAGNALGNMGRKAGMAGVQIEQLVGQISMGTSPMRAFSMQAADIGIVLGAPLLGAVVGITAALAGPFITALLDSGTAVDELQEKLEELAETQLLTADQAAFLAMQEKNSIAERKETIDSLKEEIATYEARSERIKKAWADAEQPNKQAREQLEAYGENLVKLRADLSLVTMEQGEAANKLEFYNGIVDGTVTKTAEQTEATNSLVDSLSAQIVALEEGEKAAVEYNIAQSLGLESTEQIPAAIQAQIDKIYELKEAKAEQAAFDAELAAQVAAEAKAREDAEKAAASEAKKSAAEYEKLMEQVDNFGGAWTRTGNVIVDAFGDISDAMNDFSSQMKTIGDLQDKLATKKTEYLAAGKSTLEIDEASAKLNEETYAAQAGALGQLTGLAAGYFEENSKERKALHALEMGFLAAEIVLIADKAVANAAAAIASAGSAPFPVGFAAAAAMTAVMAGVLGAAGIAFSGGSGGGSGTGTGSDATAYGGGISESLADSTEDMKDIMLDQLAELRGLRSDLSSVDDLTYGLFRDLLAVDPGHSEIRDRTEKELQNSLNELNFDSDTYSFTGTLRGIFDSVEDTIDTSLGILGLSANRSIDNFIFDVSKISFDKLSAEDAESRLDQVLSAQSDKMVEWVAPFITQYQQVGEGALETLTRVAKEFVIFNDSLDIMGMQLGDIGAMIKVDISQSIIDLVGGIDEFSDAVSEFFDEFLTEEEQFEYSTNSLTEALDSIGLGLFDSRDAFTDYIQGLDLTNEAHQAIYAGLLELIPALDDYYDTIEDTAAEALALAEEKATMEIALLRAQGNEEAAIMLERADILESLDPSLRALQQEIWNVSDASEAAAEELALIEEARELRIDALEEERDLLQSVVDKYLPSAQSSLITVQAALDAARMGDFSLADQLSVPTISSSGYATRAEYAVAQARQDAMLAEIGILAEEQLSEVDEQISLLEQQNETLDEINSNIITMAGLDGATSISSQNEAIVETNEKVVAINEDMKNMQQSMTQNMAKMANDINQIKLDGLSVYTRGDDTVAVTGV